MNNNSSTALKYDKSKMYTKFDSMLKKIDKKYMITLINFENISL